MNRNPLNLRAEQGWADRLLTVVPITPRTSSLLDLMRWIAATLVLVYHIRINVLVEPGKVSPDAADLEVSLLYLLTNVGTQAVVWFFVLSGFLVGGSVVSDARRGRFEFGRYTLNRAVRLYIVLLPALAIGYAMDFVRISLFGIDPAAGEEGPNSYGFWPFVANLLFLQTILVPNLGSNSPLWSLAYEGWYYVAFPLLAGPLMANRPIVARIILVLLGLVVLAFLSQNPSLVRMFLIWGIGVAARLAPPPPAGLRPLAWVLAVVTFITYPILHGALGGLATVIIGLSFGATLTAEAHVPADTAPLRWHHMHAVFANFSFSLYIIHAPLLHLILTLFQQSSNPRMQFQPEGLQPVAWSIGLFVALVVLAWVFSLFTEAQTGKVRTRLARLSEKLRG